MIPDRTTSMQLLNEAYELNPGPWKAHSLVTAECAEKIAACCPGMDSEKAFIFGLLHDIGRRFGVTQLAHVINGYDYLMALGFDEPARISLTHSFAVKDIHTYIGIPDVSEEDCQRISDLIASFDYDDYDRLIQLCDSIAMAEGPTDMVTRMSDVKNRYGFYPREKWDKHLELQKYFEDKMWKSLNEVLSCQTSNHQIQ